MLLSPDSPQLSLGETDEENSTKPHVQPTLLPPSPTLYHSSFLLLLFSPPFPPHFAGRNRAPHSSSPLPFVALSSPLLSHSTAFSSPQPRFTAFLPPDRRSSLALRPRFTLQSNFWDDWSMAGRELTNSWSVAEWGVFSLLFLCSNLIIFYSLNSSLPPLCLSVSFLVFISLFLSLTELWIFVRLPQRGNIYVFLNFFFPSKPKRGLELGGACLPHVEACWIKTNVILLNGWHFEKVSLVVC